MQTQLLNDTLDERDHHDRPWYRGKRAFLGVAFVFAAALVTIGVTQYGETTNFGNTDDRVTELDYNNACLQNAAHNGPSAALQKKLCMFAMNDEPARCYNQLKTNHPKWNSVAMVNICQNSRNAQTTACFLKNYPTTRSVQKLLTTCNANCHNDCECAANDIPNAGLRTRLCKGATNTQPANCYNQLKKDHPKWSSVAMVNICQHSRNAQTTECFRKNYPTTRNVQKLLLTCNANCRNDCECAVKDLPNAGLRTRLCKNSPNNVRPAQCYNRLRRGELAAAKWAPSTIVNLCERIDNADAPVDCFQRELQQQHAQFTNAIFDAAISQCDRSNVQHRTDCSNTCDCDIRDAPTRYYRNQLCNDTPNNNQPARCYNQLQQGSVKWRTAENAASYKWQPNWMVKLCQGSHNAHETINCFQQRLNKGGTFATASSECRKQLSQTLVNP